MKQSLILPSSPRWMLVVLGLMLGACASNRERRSDPLPFRLAVTPAIVSTFESQDAGEERVGMPFEVLTESFTEALAEQLRGSNFIEVIVLPSDSEDWTSEDWNAKAKEAHADLILTSRLNYDPLARSNPNGRFFLNLPLFFLGGPFCWFVRDRSYRYEALLDVQVFDANLPGDVSAAMGSRNVVSIAAVSTDDSLADLNFMERAGGAGSYVLSFFIPAGFIAPKSDNAAETIGGKITKQLAKRVSELLENRHREILSVRAVPFDVVSWNVARSGNSYEFEGTVDVHLDTDVQELGECQILMGDQVLSNMRVDNANAVRGMVNENQRVRRTDISGSFPAPDDQSNVRLSITAGEAHQRTFTIDLSGVSARSASLSGKDGGKIVNVFSVRTLEASFTDDAVRAIEASSAESSAETLPK